jgi:hypothetical protein
MVTEENTVVDIGFGEGELSDGRPFRIEYWAEDGICTITYIMSIEGLEGESKESLADMLVSEGLLVFLDHENRYLGVTEMTDASGNRMLWMHTVIGDDEGVYAEGKYPLYPYPGAPWA